MLLRFKIKNYKSFADEAILDVSATPIKEHNNSLINVNKINILPICVIFGANASGKSNIFNAFELMKNYILGNYVNQNYPFLFDSSYLDKPTEFEVCIVNKITLKEYRYGFSIYKEEFVEEWLFEKTFSKTYTVEEKCVFYRTNNKLESDLKNEKNIKEIRFVHSVTNNNELLITNIGKRDNVTYSYIYNWFKNEAFYLDFSYANESGILNDQKALKSLYENNEWLSISKELINSIDSSIIDIQVKKENISNCYKVYSIHKDNNNKKIVVPFEIESCGTIKILTFALLVMKSLTEGHVLLFDEFDSKLHPLLLRYFIKLYTNKERNVAGGQLIFSSHNIICLDSSDLRRDEIFFVEKKKQKSTLFSLYDFKEYNKIRNDLDFNKHYLTGRFGAIPFLDK